MEEKVQLAVLSSNWVNYLLTLIFHDNCHIHRIPQRLICYQVSNVFNQTKINKIGKLKNCRLVSTVWQELQHYRLVLVSYPAQVPDWPRTELILRLGVPLCLTRWTPDKTVAFPQCAVKAMHSWQWKTLEPHPYLPGLTHRVWLPWLLVCLSCWPPGPISGESPILFTGKKRRCWEGAKLCHHRQGILGIEHLRSFTGREQQLPWGVKKQSFQIKISRWFM